jgi:hypothetical protein
MLCRLTALLLVALVSSACSSYTIPRYGLSADNVLALKKVGQKVNVGPFTASPPGRAEIGCRGKGPVKTPDERPFEDYIRRALIDELKVAEVLSDSAPVTLTANLGQIDFSSLKGEWTMDVTFASSNGRSLALPILYSFKTGPAFTFPQLGSQAAADERACAETAQAFPAAVQVLIGKLVHHPEFAAMLR